MEYTTEDILRLLPHRYPFIMVDKILEVEPNVSIRALKNVSFNEPQFTGHFPEHPIMPGVLMIEAMAQVCGLLGFITLDSSPAAGVNYLLVGVDNMKVRRPVIPGDALIMSAKIDSRRRSIWRYTVSAEVDGKRVIDGTLSVAEQHQTIVPTR